MGKVALEHISSSKVILCLYLSTAAPYSLVSSGEMGSGPVSKHSSPKTCENLTIYKMLRDLDEMTEDLYAVGGGALE